jgi:hypothetical protein
MSLSRAQTGRCAISEIGTIAIMPNDTATYHEDSFDNMKAFAAKHGFMRYLSYSIGPKQIRGARTKLPHVLAANHS